MCLCFCAQLVLREFTAGAGEWGRVLCWQCMNACHIEVSAKKLCFLVQPSLAMVGSDLTLQLDASLLFPPTPHCSHQLMVGDITENMSRRCVHTGGKILPLFSRGPHLLLMHLQLFLDEAADLVEGGSPCGLQAPARLHDAVPAGPHRDREVVGAAVGVCSPRLFPAACCMSGTHAERTERSLLPKNPW